jgi:nicotinamide phosphoribosyltransferase
MLFKDPKTDDGVKKSLKGRIIVLGDGHTTPFYAKDELTHQEQHFYKEYDNLQTTWRNGFFYKKWNVGELRANIRR